MKSRLFVCGGLSLNGKEAQAQTTKVVELSSWGANPNVHIQLEDVSRAFAQNLSPRLIDLIEIAAYVYTADCSIPRDGAWSGDNSVEPWSRKLDFVIPVRDAQFWSNSEIGEKLRGILHFLSDDNFEFDFKETHGRFPVQQSYFDFSQEDWPFYGVDRVVMFSGGLDSLAGALETASRGENLVLVSHRPAPTLSKRQQDLFQCLQDLYPQCKMLHVPVWVNKEKKLGREHTQRTRSFLYAALGAAVAHSIRACGVRFFENGIVSLNLPVADEVLRARASRTTHPLFLAMMTDFLSSVFEDQVTVDNPFLYKTKADVLATIKSLGGRSLIKNTCSCAHTGFFQSKTQWHCGTCSQCIDRRIAIVATELESDDPEYDYVEDVFCGKREAGYERNIAVDYIRHAFELSRMSEQEMATKFNLEISRAVRALRGNKRESAQKLIEMHKHHGETVWNVVTQKLAANLPSLLAGDLPQNSMLMTVAGLQHLTNSWIRYGQQISALLELGVPVACNSHKPENEPHLQEICDGILKANEPKLVREFPFARWSSSMTKPDWSLEGVSLWIEAKYVRQKRDIRQITEDIAADITKYGDSQKHVLYVVYDPAHLVVDEEEFSRPISKRQDMMVRFVR